jgi:RimJ/RimL family protein N-acetyltransferase
MIEIGLGVEPEERGRGYAQEMLRGMWGWVVDQPGVRMLRYTVSPDNGPSQAIIRRFGFAHRGQQVDDEDGPEDIYELSADEYRRQHLA